MINCPFCGGAQFQIRRAPYLYEHQGRYLLAPDLPMEICLNCGMEFYDGPALEAVENHFFAIQRREEQPDRIIELPVKSCTA